MDARGWFTWIVCEPTKIQGHSPGERNDMRMKKGSLEKLQHGTGDPAEEPFVEATGDDTDCSVGVELLTDQKDERPRRERLAPKWTADYVLRKWN
ncbi:hypothetical protein E2C01_085880 [Portunus trituberculatus]|uniref:Uncharacterized protein n=1 Tax=Portunus trituberculatus TaxID=210409 RepID=A0A5B7JA24_PORTR|nr:hypothetical protein [Portunus trituberculatus]